MSKISNFYCVEDLFDLAIALREIKVILKEQKFPTTEYLEWLKKQK